MGAIADLSDLINRVSGGNNGNPQHLWTWIDSRIGAAAGTTPVAGEFTSLWRYNATRGGCGAIPTVAENPTRATAGALKQANASGGRELHLLGIEGWSSQVGSIVLYDRLAHIGGLSGALTISQTVNLSTTRYNTQATCDGVRIAVEIYSQIGGTSTTITASYTNQDGTSGRTTQPVVLGGAGNRDAERLQFLPLQAGDTGVLSVQSVILSASTGVTGNFGITLIKDLVMATCSVSSTGFQRDCVTGLPSIPKVEADACLAWYWLPINTNLPQLMLCPHFVEA